MSELEPNTVYIRKRVGRNVFDSPPRISVVITAHNQARNIRETVESVIDQKYREHEIIVVNDGSDDTHQFERELKMRFEDIVYIRQRHAGEGAARNAGIEHGRGSIVAFLNAGDVWQKDFLAIQYVYLERHSLDLVYCDASVFGTSSAYRRTFMQKYPSVGEVNSETLLSRQCSVLISGAVARKDAILRAGGFEIERVGSPGFHLWVRMAKCGSKIGFHERQLVKLRIQPNHLPDDALERVERERDVLERVKRTIELNRRESDIVSIRIAELEAQIAIEQGNTFLRSGDYTEAIAAFRVAGHHQPSIKTTAMTWLTRVAPRAAARFAATEYLADKPNFHGQL